MLLKRGTGNGERGTGNERGERKNKNNEIKNRMSNEVSYRAKNLVTFCTHSSFSLSLC